jgi:predicted dehydrogenase
MTNYRSLQNHRERVRIGILSVAHVHADAYQANLRAIPGVDLVGFSHENRQEGRAFEEKFGARWFSSYQDLLSQGLDGVIVCAENARHHHLVEIAAAAGCQILCEKPIETNLSDAEAMKTACEKNGVSFMTAFPMRFAASTNAVRAMLRNGDLGSVFGVNGINHSENPMGHRAWFASRELAGGGAVMDHTVHLADLFRWCFAAEVIEVYAEVDNLFARGKIDVDTAGLLLVTLANGVKASIDCSWSRPVSYPRWGHLKMEIIGVRGTLVVDSLAEYLTLYSQNESRNPTWIGFGKDPNQAMIQEFIDSIIEQRQPSIAWNDGYQALRIALAAYESAQKKAPIRLADSSGA